MAAELLNIDQRRLLLDKLVETFVAVERLQTWLQQHLPSGQAKLGMGDLEQELTNLIVWANAEDGMSEFLQTLADHPPHGNQTLTQTIYGLTVGKIKAQSQTAYGLPKVAPHLSWFAADRPFVNRTELRDHLADLDASSPGAKCILVIDGEDRSGKSFAVSLAVSCQAPERRLPTIDVDDFAKVGAILDARELACQIAGDEEGCPAYDPTKEDEAVPRLILWLTKRLKTKQLWIIFDHLNRKSLTSAALSVLRGLTERIRMGELPNVRLILVDFDRNQFPQEWRDDVRHDRAVLPDRDRVEEWCKQIATAAKRKHSKKEVEQWVNDVFSRVEGHNLQDGAWHRELEGQLRAAVGTIMKCKPLP